MPRQAPRKPAGSFGHDRPSGELDRPTASPQVRRGASSLRIGAWAAATVAVGAPLADLTWLALPAYGLALILTLLAWGATPRS